MHIYISINKSFLTLSCQSHDYMFHVMKKYNLYMKYVRLYVSFEDFFFMKYIDYHEGERKHLF